MRILYATDGSAGALAAADFLRGLSFRADASIHVVTVSDAPDREAVLGAARERLAGLSASVTTEALSGNSTAPAQDAILRASEAIGADIIVLGSSGHSSLAQFFVGSVAGGVARHAHCSVLMVRAGSKAGLTSAVIGVDSSPRARSAVLWAAGTLPLPLACELRLVAVVPSETWTTFRVPSETDPTNPALAHETIRVQTLEEERQRAESWMASLVREAHRATTGNDKLRSVMTEVRQGNRVDGLLQAAEDAGAGLIIVGTKERTLLERFFISSVSERVLRHAPCSVLIIRAAAA